MFQGIKQAEWTFWPNSVSWGTGKPIRRQEDKGGQGLSSRLTLPSYHGNSPPSVGRVRPFWQAFLWASPFTGGARLGDLSDQFAAIRHGISSTSAVQICSWSPTQAALASADPALSLW
jgi:hypothetical protein